ncbi:MAG: hypothetical protein JOZ19_13460 [Rubrobacter sp.]|nr:hypothetical protein [Rubrobacter sp.]
MREEDLFGTFAGCGGLLRSQTERLESWFTHVSFALRGEAGFRLLKFLNSLKSFPEPQASRDMETGPGELTVGLRIFFFPSSLSPYHHPNSGLQHHHSQLPALYIL